MNKALLPPSPSNRIFPDAPRSNPLHPIARLAAKWVAAISVGGSDWDDAHLRTLAANWHPASALQIALLPEAERISVATVQELVELLAQSPQGRQALAAFGFKPVLDPLRPFADVAEAGRAGGGFSISDLKEHAADAPSMPAPPAP